MKGDRGAVRFVWSRSRVIWICFRPHVVYRQDEDTLVLAIDAG